MKPKKAIKYANLKKWIHQSSKKGDTPNFRTKQPPKKRAKKTRSMSIKRMNTELITRRVQQNVGNQRNRIKHKPVYKNFVINNLMTHAQNHDNT